MKTIQPFGTAKFLLAWLSPGMPSFTAVAKPSNLKFKVSHRDVLGRHISKYGHHEPQLTSWIARHLEKSSRGLFVDVGANIGWHAIHAAKCSSVETVIAFEPDAFNAWLLDQSLTLNAIDNVVVHGCAAGDHNGIARLHRYKSSNNGRHSLIPFSNQNTRAVPMMTIDKALAMLDLNERDILMMKIDVEGFEPAVIAGAATALTKTKVVITEFSPELSRDGGLSVMTMASQLTALGFSPHTLLPSGELNPVTTAELEMFRKQTDLIWMRQADGASR